MSRFEGRSVLVVGASRGIGAAVSAAFAAEGATVLLASRDVTAARAVAADIRRAGGDADAVAADATDSASVADAVERIRDRCGRLDVAFNNAGVQGPAAPLHHQTDETWEAVLGVNLRGLFVCMRAELAAMVDHGSGAIVNTASVGGMVAARGISPYCASKHGVIGLSKSAALDYAADGIRINVVAPGAIDTDIFNDWMADAAARAHMESLHPVGRIGRVDEVNGAVLWLASDEASYVTGSVVTVDGGYTIG